MKFSIITPTYNREDLVQTTIKSILAQTFTDWELFIVDDGSTDNTEQVIQQYLKDNRIKYIKKANSGQADSLNVGTSYTSGEYITFLDSDDEAYSNWLEVVNKNIKEDTCVVCVGAMRKLLNGSLVHEYINKWKFFGEIIRFKFTCGSLFLKRSIFFEIGGYDPEMQSNIQTDMGYRLLINLKNTNRKIVAVDEYLVQVNIHDGPRIRTNWEKRRDGTKLLLRKHYEFIKENIPKDILNCYAIIAFANYKLKQRRESLHYIFKVIKIKPFIVSNYLKLFRYSFM